jgi:peptide/nickel transport system permease protein
MSRADRSVTLPGWLPWIGVRVLSGLAAIAVVSALVFLATHALPSDPARVMLGPEATEASVRALARQLGLDQPLLVQYQRWIAGVARGELGRSLDSEVAVGRILGPRLANTFALVTVVVAAAVPFAVAFGALLARRRGSRLDRWTVSALIFGKAIPPYVTGIALVLLLATGALRIFPATSLLDPNASPWLQPRFLALPALTLFLSVAPYLVRLAREAFVDVLDSEWILLARLRGVPERRLLLRHALPNAIVPVIQGTALVTSVLIGGAVVVEVVFAYPGVGTTLATAVDARDLPLIQAIVVVITTAIVAINLGADLVTTLLTPRLRTARAITLRLSRVSAAEVGAAAVERSA